MITVVGDCMRDCDVFYTRQRSGDGGFPVSLIRPAKIRHGGGGALAVALMLNYLRAPFQTAHRPQWLSHKTRLIAGGRVVLRLDRDCRHECSTVEMNDFLARLVPPRVVCVVDHGKGMITPSTWPAITIHAAGAPIVVDKAVGRQAADYAGAWMVKGNEREWQGEAESAPPGGQTWVITRGGQGLSLLTCSGNHHWPALPTSPVDCCGAGDMITACLAAALLYGITLPEVLDLAVELAAHVCCHWGAVPPTGIELAKRFWSLAQSGTMRA